MSHRIELPTNAWEGLGAGALIAGAACIAAAGPVTPGWRVALAIATLLIGASQWWHYHQRRPQALLIANGGNLVLERPDGTTVSVTEVRPGLVGPALLAARLRLTNGQHVDLFVPGGRLSSDDHRIVRAALLRHRPDESQPDAGRGR